METPNFIVIGSPGSGKTTYTKELAALHPDHKVFHTDDYMDYWYEEALYKLIEDLELSVEAGNNFIVEWIQCYRLLRKLVQQNSPLWKNIVIIDLIVSEAQLMAVYQMERPDKDFAAVQKMIKANAKVYADFLAIAGDWNGAFPYEYIPKLR